MVIRKLFGTISLVSLVGSGQQLGEFCVSLGNEVIAIFHEQLTNGRRANDEGFPLMMIDTALRLGFLASEAERSMKENGEISRETIGEMVQMVCKAHDWAKNTMRLVDWLSMILTQRWGFQGAGKERLREFIANSNLDLDDYLELTWETKE